MTTKSNTPNDDRSNVKNPNNPAHDADRVNREKQGHGNTPQPTQPKQEPKK